MTSRQRVLASLNHQEPDRVPFDIGSTPSSGISAIAYTNLKKYIGMTGGHTRVYDVVQQVAQPEDEFINRFGIDVVDIGRAFNDKDEDWYDVQLADGSTAQFPVWFKPEHQSDGSFIFRDEDGDKLAMMPAGGTFYDQTYFPYVDDFPDNYDNLDEMMNKVLWQRLAHSPWDSAHNPDFYETLRKKALHLRETTDKALMIVCGCNLFEWGTFLRRFDNFLMDIYSEQDEVEKLLSELMIRHMATLEKVCQAVGDVADVLRFGDDLGMNTNAFMSNDIYRKVFKPHHTKLCDYVHKNSQMKTFIHCCGSIRMLLPDLIEAGYDIINPVQTSAYDMDPVDLKRDFGRDLTFWGGGCDTRSVLNRGTPEEVYDFTTRRIEVLMPGGGFIFNTEHNILPDVPPENIVAMHKAIMDYK